MHNKKPDASSLEMALLNRINDQSIDLITSQQRAWFDYVVSTNNRGETLLMKLEEDFTGSLKGKKILDIGAGYGGVCVAAAKRGGIVVGIELSDKNIELAQENFKDYPDLPIELIKLNILESSDYLKRWKGFDLIICDNVLEHVAIPSKLISVMSLLLEKTGIVYLTVPNSRSIGQVKKECHYGMPGISLLSPYVAAMVLRERKISQSYDVSFYYEFATYVSFFERYGLRYNFLLAEVASDRDIDEIVADFEEMEKVVGSEIFPVSTSAIMEEAFREYKGRFLSDIEWYRETKGSEYTSRISGKIARDYKYGLWYFILRK